jgi:alkanesulfonate monooxygenase
MLDFNGRLNVFTTCPQSKGFDPSAYTRAVAEVSEWSDAAGCTGMLVYTDNGLVDPWIVGETVLRSTRRLCPLIAVQPVYMHPYAAAKIVATWGFMHGRRAYLNMLAGGFRNDLIALGDKTPHDARYEKTTEYALIMRRLLEADAPVTFNGLHYDVQGARMSPALAPALFPGFLISGSSEAGRSAARLIGATAVEYPPPPEEVATASGGAADTPRGLRIGLIARDNPEEAWRVARERFPGDRRGQIEHALAMKTSDSSWHRELSRLARNVATDGPYWLWPFENYKTFCPYLVGDFGTVATVLAAYLDLGYTAIILDIPREPADLETAAAVLRTALAKSGAGEGPPTEGRRS